MKKIIPLLLALAGIATAHADPAMMKDGALTGPTGMTLYVFDKDEAGKSACNGKCAENWPPLLAQETDKAQGDWGVVTREDGRRQWSYKGKPLYHWVKDQKPGERTGDGFNGVWHVAK